MSERYRIKPGEVEAIQVSPEAWHDICDFVYANHSGGPVPDHLGEATEVVGPPRANFPLIINTIEGTMRADVGDWIVRGARGELSAVKSHIFEAAYEHVPEANGDH